MLHEDRSITDDAWTVFFLGAPAGILVLRTGQMQLLLLLMLLLLLLMLLINNRSRLCSERIARAHPLSQS